MEIRTVFNDGREITLTAFQAQVFNAAVNQLKIGGFEGTPLLEDTYILQKSLAEYIATTVTEANSTETVSELAITVYREVLGFEPTNRTRTDIGNKSDLFDENQEEQTNENQVGTSGTTTPPISTNPPNDGSEFA